jgi:hypothetical protein
MSYRLRRSLLAAVVILVAALVVPIVAEPKQRFLLCDTRVLGEVRIEIGGFFKNVAAARKHCIDDLDGIPKGIVE